MTTTTARAQPERLSLVLFGLIAGFVVFYLPTILLKGLGTPDDQKTFWIHARETCCFQSWDSQTMGYLGRIVGGWMHSIQNYFIRELDDLVRIRLVSVLIEAIGCFTFFLYFRRFVNFIPALLVAVALFMVPAFVLGVVWTHAIVYLVVPALFGFWGGVLVVDPPARLGTLGGALAGGLVLILALYSYQPSAMYFMLPLAIQILFCRSLGEAEVVDRGLRLAMVFVIGAITYYTVHRYIFLPRFFELYPRWSDEMMHTSHARFFVLGSEGFDAALMELQRKAKDLLAMSILAFNVIWHTPREGVAYAVAAFIAAGLIVGGRGTVDGPIPTRVLGWRSVLTILGLALATTAPTMAAAGGYYPVRIMGAFSSIVLVLVVWSLVRLCRGHLAILQFAAVAVAIAVPATVQSISVLSTATARMVFDAAKSQLALSVVHPIQSIWVVNPDSPKANPYGLTLGREFTYVTITRLLTDVMLADLGYAFGVGYDYQELGYTAQEIALSERDALIDTRHLSNRLAKPFTTYDIVREPRTSSVPGRCDPSTGHGPIYQIAPPNWGPNNVSMEILEPEPRPLTRLRTTAPGALQRAARRFELPGGQPGDLLTVRMSVLPAGGAKTMGLRFTLNPLGYQILADAPIKEGGWQCVSAEFVTPVAHENGDFFIYPGRTAVDQPPGEVGLQVDVAELQLWRADRPRMANLLPPLRLWKLRSDDRSQEGIAGAARAIDRNPATPWRIRDRRVANLFIDLPQAEAALASLSFIGWNNPTLAMPTEVRVYSSADGLAWTAVSNGAFGAARTLTLPLPASTAERHYRLEFAGPAGEWGLGEIKPAFTWR